MPQIPGSDPAQVIQSGTASQAISADEAGLAGRAIGGLGRSMVELGNAMDRTVKMNRDKTGQYNVEAAIADYEAEIQRFSRDDAYWGEKGTLTGTDAVLRMREHGGKVRDTLSKNYGLSGEMAAMFVAKTKGVDNNYSPSLYDASAKAAQAETQKARETMIQKKGAIVASAILGGPNQRANPGVFQETMVGIEDVVRSDQTIPEHMKESAVQDAQKQIVMSAYNEMRFRKGFKEAQQFLKLNKGLFSEKEYATEVNALDTDRVQWSNYSWTQEQRQEKEYERNLMEAQQTASQTFLAEIESAGTSFPKLQLARAKLELAYFKGDVNKEQFEMLSKRDPSARKELDSLTAGRVTQKAFITGNFDRGIREIETALKKGDVSPSQYQETVTLLGKYLNYKRDKRTQNQMDMTRMAISETIAYIKAAGKDPYSVDTVQQKKIGQLVLDVIGMFQQDFNKGISPNVGETIRRAADGYGSEFLPVAPKTKGGAQTKARTSSEVRAEYLNQRRIFEKNSPSWNDQQRASAKNEMEKVMQLYKMRLQEEQQEGKPNGTGSANQRFDGAARRGQ